MGPNSCLLETLPWQMQKAKTSSRKSPTEFETPDHTPSPQSKARHPPWTSPLEVEQIHNYL